jgi:hypothetical protein
MTTCIEIEVDDAGAMTVGICPPAEESGEDKSYMQPVPDMDAALAKVRELLSKGTDQSTPVDASKPTTMMGAMFPEKGQAKA